MVNVSEDAGWSIISTKRKENQAEKVNASLDRCEGRCRHGCASLAGLLPKASIIFFPFGRDTVPSNSKANGVFK